MTIMLRNALSATLSAVCFLVFTSGTSWAQGDHRVLAADFNSDKSQQMMRSYLRGHAHDALDRRLKELESALAGEEQLAAYQKRRREFLHWTLGEMPQRSPLNARVVGTIQDDGFTIEKVLFESQPGFHVTASVYRPQGDGPFPAILHPVGHAENGKAYAAYQRANRLLARNGFVVLCFDPIGQGERKQLFAADGKSIQRASGEHQQLGVAPILLGRGLGSYMVWDGVRALDYLCSRPDVDRHRIGCTGNSGGGNLTSYLMAYDDRIAAAAPGCFMTTHRHKNESPGPGDAEQNLFAQIRDGFDHPDFILSRAPKPTLILAATNDFVPIEGTWEAFRQAKRVYSQLGYPERVELIEANAKHGFSRRLREGAVRFFARWLQDRRIEVFEEDDAVIHSEKELRVTPDGQVSKLPDERSMLNLFQDYERELAAKRPKLTREIVRKVTGIRTLADLPTPIVDGPKAKRFSAPRKLVFHPERGIVLPALHWPHGDDEPVLIAPSEGMNSAVKQAEKLNADGHPVLIVEVRDTGETKTRNWRFFGADYYIAHMLGRCWLGMRTEDLLVSARWMTKQHDATSVRLLADGEIGPAALHAAALEPRLVAAARVKNSLPSWRELMTSTAAQEHVHNSVQGALRYYDLPDLVELAGKDRVELGAAIRGSRNDAVPTKGLVAHWRFDEGAGQTATDSSPSGREGTIHNAEWVEGRDGGKALRFDGKRSWVDCGNADVLNLANEFTIEAWVKPENPGGHSMTILAKGYRYRGRFNLRMGTPWDRSKLMLENGAYRTHEIPIPWETWSHVAGVCDGQRVAIFVNGQLQSVRPFGGGFKPNQTALTIGKSIGAPDGEFFKGSIDDVRIHDRALARYKLSGATGRDINRGSRPITTDGEWGGYEGFPSVCLLKNGHLLVSFYAGRGHMDWPDPALPNRGRICVMRSSDLGKTWSQPRAIIDTSVGERDPSLSQLSDGTVICSYFQTVWYQHGRVCEVRTIRSFDNGQTWESKPAEVPSPWFTQQQKSEVLRLAGPPSTDASHEHPVKEEFAAINATSAPVTELSSGDLLLPIYGHYTGGSYRCAVARSTDHGATWTATHILPASGHLTEPDLVELPDGRLLCVMRTEMAHSFSSDQGRTWTKPRTGLLPRGAAPDLLLTRDGVLLCGIREQPSPRTGVIISTDYGKSWSRPRMIGFAGGAYPSLTELPDGRIFAVHYQEALGGNVLQSVFAIDRNDRDIRLESLR